MVRRQPQRRLAVQPGAGDVVLGLGAQPRELHVRVGGLGAGRARARRAGGRRASAPARSFGLVRGAGERLERRQVVRLEAEQLVQRLHRHLRRVVAGGAGGGLGGEEGGGLLRGACARGRTARGSARRRGRALRGARAPRPRPTARRGSCRGGAAARRRRRAQLVRLGIGDEQRQQPLGGEGVRLVGVAEPAGTPRAPRRACPCGDERLGVGEGARALERQQQLLVGRSRRRQPAGGEAQAAGPALQTSAADRRAGVERGILKPRLTAAALAERGQHPGGEAGGAAQLDLGEQLQAPAPRVDDQRRQLRRGRWRRSRTAARRRGRPRAARRRRRRRP